MKRSTLVLTGVGGVLALGIAAAVPVLGLGIASGTVDRPGSSGAQAIAVATSSPAPGSRQDLRRELRELRKAARADRQDELVRLLAKELGLPESKVSAALDKVRTQLRAEARSEGLARLSERLDAAVQQGRLTRAQADAVLEAAKNGVLHGHRGMGRAMSGSLGFAGGFGSPDRPGSSGAGSAATTGGSAA